MGKSARVPVSKLSALLAAAAAGTLALSALPSNAAQPAETGRPVDISTAFTTAATKYDVPRELLVGVGYAESHLDGHDGKPSQANGYGVMHLVSNNKNRTMTEAAKLTGLPVEQLAKDTPSNILGAAAVLDSYADASGLQGDARKDPGRWYEVVAQVLALRRRPDRSPLHRRGLPDHRSRRAGAGRLGRAEAGHPAAWRLRQGRPARHPDRVVGRGRRLPGRDLERGQPQQLHRRPDQGDLRDHHPRDAGLVRRDDQLVQEPVGPGQRALRDPVQRRPGHPDGGREGHGLARRHARTRYTVGIEHEGFVDDAVLVHRRDVPVVGRADPQHRRPARHPEGPGPHQGPQRDARTTTTPTRVRTGTGPTTCSW